MDCQHKEKRLSKRKDSIKPANKKLGDYLTATGNDKDTASVVFTNVTKSFGSNVVLDNLSMAFANGKTTCIMGPSGTSKSNLIRNNNALEEIDSGTITVNGVKVSKGSKKGLLRRRPSEFRLTKARRNSGTAMVFQQFHLFQNYSVLQNMTLAPHFVGQRPTRDSVADGANLLHLFGLSHLIKIGRAHV